MGNLYLVNGLWGCQALSLAQEDPDAILALIQDGVYLDAEEMGKAGRPVYALREDVELRGLGARLPAFIQVIGYPQLIDLIVENKVINFV